jgi:hypothetical protein
MKGASHRDRGGRISVEHASAVDDEGEADGAVDGLGTTLPFMVIHGTGGIARMRWIALRINSPFAP